MIKLVSKTLVLFVAVSVVEMGSQEENGEFYLRYHVGHIGKHGHEFFEFEFTRDGKLQYANNSNYKNDTMIRKQVYVSPAVIRECRRMVLDSEVTNPNFLPFINPLLLMLIFNWLVLAFLFRLCRKMIAIGQNPIG
jgi:hypothetical protein